MHSNNENLIKIIICSVYTTKSTDGCTLRAKWQRITLCVSIGKCLRTPKRIETVQVIWWYVTILWNLKNMFWKRTIYRFWFIRLVIYTENETFELDFFDIIILFVPMTKKNWQNYQYVTLPRCSISFVDKILVVLRKSSILIGRPERQQVCIEFFNGIVDSWFVDEVCLLDDTKMIYYCTYNLQHECPKLWGYGYSSDFICKHFYYFNIIKTFKVTTLINAGKIDLLCHGLINT